MCTFARKMNESGMIPLIKMEDYRYDLPEDRIAKYPLPERDASKLLVYRDGKVSDTLFRNLAEVLPSPALMVFNETKVVPARLHFLRPTGAHIEIFCLEPVEPAEYDSAFACTSSCLWKCVIGNAKRWKDDTLTLYNPQADPVLAAMGLEARLCAREGRTGTVAFTWRDGASFSQVMERCGQVPIPPYLRRDTEAVDRERYQTLYARIRGSVAAPTAGLHFTDRVLSAIDRKGIRRMQVCLHVGAGTFLPVKGTEISDHPMHREPFRVRRTLLESLLAAETPVIAVGTTCVRTLESLYYAGVDCLERGEPSDVSQWAPYLRDYPYSTREALEGLVSWMERNRMEEFTLGTRIIIVPGFRFRLVDVLVTNFHQPESTLILLVSAFLDGDWRKVYDHALRNGFRFLSYGDSSVLFRQKSL